MAPEGSAGTPGSRPIASDRRAAFALALCLALALVLFWALRLLRPGVENALDNADLYLYYYPSYASLYALAREGVLPGWNPYQSTGVPALASLQAGFFYPPHLLYLLLPTRLAMALLGLSHLLLAAFAMLALARRLGLVWPAAVVAGLSLAMRGRYPALLFVPNVLEAASWLPVGALAVTALVRGGGRRALAALAACTGMSLLAGYPQASVFICYAWGAWGAIVMLADRTPVRDAALRGALLGLAVALGAALAATQLVPSLELTQLGVRSLERLDLEAMHPGGIPSGGIGEALISTLGFGLPKLALSVGGAALLLWPFALLARRHRRIAGGCLAMLLLISAYAIGPPSPLFEAFLELPAIAWFRNPRRSLMLADFFFAIGLAIAVHGFLEWLRWQAAPAGSDSAGGSRRSLIAAAALGALALPLCTVIGDGRALGFALAAAAILGLAYVVHGRAGPARAGQIASTALVLLIGIEIFAAPPNPFHLVYASPAVDHIYRDALPIYARLAGSSDRVWIRNDGLWPRLPPKLGSLQRMRSIEDYEPLQLRRLAEYWTWLREGRTQTLRKDRPFAGRLFRLTAPRQEGALQERSRLLDVAAVRYFLIPVQGLRSRELRTHLETTGFRLLETGEGLLAPEHAGADTESHRLVLYENPHALPRAYVVHRTLPAPPAAELLAIMSRRDFDPLALSYVEGEAGQAHAAHAPARGRAAEIVVDEAELVEIELEASAAGLLVLADTFHPGWRATVDGTPREIVAVNHIFRGVPVTEGRHRVRFEYRPWRLRLGAAISLTAAALCAGLAWRAPRRARALA